MSASRIKTNHGCTKGAQSVFFVRPLCSLCLCGEWHGTVSFHEFEPKEVRPRGEQAEQEPDPEQADERVAGAADEVAEPLPLTAAGVGLLQLAEQVLRPRPLLLDLLLR